MEIKEDILFGKTDKIGDFDALHMNWSLRLFFIQQVKIKITLKKETGQGSI